jgi:uncharacterized protein YndB with AHSA1/START domain
MPNILHQIQINSTPEHVFDLIVSSEGFRSWWTHGATVLRMRIEELVAGRRVKWTCMGDPDEWERTEVEFHLAPKEGGVLLHFAHRGWRSLGGEYARCNTTWGGLMHRLKAAAEGHTPGPLFPL